MSEISDAQIDWAKSLAPDVLESRTEGATAERRVVAGP
jgi:hypothetical protein